MMRQHSYLIDTNGCRQDLFINKKTFEGARSATKKQQIVYIFKKLNYYIQSKFLLKDKQNALKP